MILPRYAYIDLAHGTVNQYPVSRDDYFNYLGGKALAAKILYDQITPGTDPVGPDNILVINTSPLTGTGAPSSSRFNISCKSPLTMGIASSNCGGTFGFKLRRAGFDGLVITGKAEKPVFIEILDGDITLSSADKYWGMNAFEVQEQFDQRYGKLVIGPAGENLVRYACAVSGERVAGRCGVGAVMGSKNLKGLAAFGTMSVPVASETEFRSYVKRWINLLKSHPSTGSSMARLGTAGFLSRVNPKHILPVNNFKRSDYEHADQISGEMLAEEHLVRNSGCVSCPIRCERRVMVGGKEVKGPEYETIGLFGSNIENSRLDFISAWNYQADLLGMDTISLAGTLALARELENRGIARFGLQPGFPESIGNIMENIAYRRGLAADLADGSRLLAEKYGAVDYAIQVKGLELASYDPRASVGLGLGYATANRGGCHLNGGFMTFLEAISPIPVNPTTTRGKAGLTVLFQNAMEAVSSGGSCLFTTFAIVPKFLHQTGEQSILNRMLAAILIRISSVIKVLNNHPSILFMDLFAFFPHVKAIRLASGLPLKTGDFLRAGERSFNIERMFNLREGIGAEQDRLPARLLTEKSRSEGVTLEAIMKKMTAEYYRNRNWDQEGKPLPALIKKLNIDAS